MKYRITVGYDKDTENPMECDDWEFYSFSTRHTSYKHPDEFADDEEIMERAFLCSYFEHGSCVWSLQGEGPQCRFDSVNTAGILIAPNADEADEKVARSILEEYTSWCNGECHYFVLEQGTECECCESISWDVIESCGGFIGGSDYPRDLIIEALPEGVSLSDCEIVGDCADLLEA